MGNESGRKLINNGSNASIQGNFGQVAVARTSITSDTLMYMGFWSAFTAIETDIENDPFAENDKQITNYPNPFDRSTTIKFDLDSPANVSLKIYDVNGNLVKELFNGYLGSGSQKIEWDGRKADGMQASAGTYLYELTVNPASMSVSKTGDYKLRNVMVLSK